MPILRFIKKNQSAIHKVGLLIAVSLQVLVTFNVLPQAIATAGIFTILCYILFDVSENIYSLSRPVKIYERQFDMYNDLSKYVEEKGAKKVIMIQCSGQMIKPLLLGLLSKDANVMLYIKSPQTSVSQLQNERVESTLKQLTGELSFFVAGKLTVHGYHAPSSLRGVLIDDSLIAIGWYTYEHILSPDKDYPNDDVELSGHDVAGILLHKGSFEYSIMKNMFMKQVDNFEKYNKNKPPLWEKAWRQK